MAIIQFKKGWDYIAKVSKLEAELKDQVLGSAIYGAAGIVADEIMRSLNVHEVEICPWALREGAILRWLDQFGRTRLGF